VVGEVVIGARASVWFGAVLRGDVAGITIGAETNIQDNSVVHVDAGQPALIGRRVTVGHRAIVHGARVEDECLIGMGAVLLSGAVVGRGSLVGAGAIVREEQVVPPGSLVLGAPARVSGPVTVEHRVAIERGWRDYVRLSRTYLARGFGRSLPAGDAPLGVSAAASAAREPPWRRMEARPAHGVRPVAARFAVITVSDTRRGAQDRGGALAQRLVEERGHRVALRAWVRDDAAAIRRAARAALERPDIDVIVLTGGTGVAPRDSTPEALAPLVKSWLSGFGELFRVLSAREVGTAAWLSRAAAGVARGKLVVMLPGSTAAVELALRHLLLPEVPHAVRQLGRSNSKE
jgi:molybdenum cofactor synthesis domain-containing protein